MAAERQGASRWDREPDRLLVLYDAEDHVLEWLHHEDHPDARKRG